MLDWKHLPVYSSLWRILRAKTLSSVHSDVILALLRWDCGWVCMRVDVCDDTSAFCLSSISVENFHYNLTFMQCCLSCVFPLLCFHMFISPLNKLLGYLRGRSKTSQAMTHLALEIGEEGWVEVSSPLLHADIPAVFLFHPSIEHWPFFSLSATVLWSPHWKCFWELKRVVGVDTVSRYVYTQSLCGFHVQI